MRLGDFAGIITTMFLDKMDITRYIDKDNGDGTTQTVLSDTPVYTDVPCRISFSSDENPADTDIDNTPLKQTPKIFCKVSADLQAGDYITVRRFNDDGEVIATYSGKVGLPNVYGSHKEALFSISGSA